MSQPSIIILGSAFPLRGGGIATFNERLAREFITQGCNTTIFTFSLQYPNFLFPGKSQYSTEEAPKDLNIKVCINSINPFNWLKIGWRLKKIEPSIIIVRYWLPLMGPCLGTILRIVKWNKKTKVICIADNIIPHEKRFGDKTFTQYFVKPIDAFITMSDKVSSDLKLFTNTRALQLLHPLYDNFGEAILKQDARKILELNEQDDIILFFGFIRKYKGLDLLFQAIKQVNDARNLIKIKPLKLLVAGEFYEDRKLYDDLINELQIENFVILKTTFIPDSDVKNYVCAADFVIQPYKNATQSGVTPLAYHFNKPMLVTNVGGLPQLVPHQKVGLVAEPNAVDIATKIEQLYQMGEDYFIPHLVAEKKKYSWDILTSNILKLAKDN